MQLSALRLAALAMTATLAACGSDSDTDAGLLINSAFDVTNPTDTEQVYRYYGDSADGAMNGPGNYGALQYGVDDSHNMWSNFATYLFKDGDRYFKAQVVSNYGEDGTLSSGNLYVRYAEVGGASDYVAADASDENLPAYFDLLAGSATTADQAWQFSYQKRIGFKVNGSVSGSGDVTACVAHIADGLYDEAGTPVEAAFKALTLENTLAAFEAVTAESCAAEDFQEDTLELQIDMDNWTDYNPTTHAVTLDTEDHNGWLIQSATQADGKYAYGRVKVSAMTFTYPTDLSISLDLELWNAETETFSAAQSSPELNYTNGRLYWDMETNSIVTENDDWELSVVLDSFNVLLQVNGGASGNGTAGVGYVLITE